MSFFTQTQTPNSEFIFGFDISEFVYENTLTIFVYSMILICLISPIINLFLERKRRIRNINIVRKRNAYIKREKRKPLYLVFYDMLKEKYGYEIFKWGDAKCTNPFGGNTPEKTASNAMTTRLLPGGLAIRIKRGYYKLIRRTARFINY